ncbi:transposase [Microseira wollei NIES-4236]|uniref:Transposase n=2 Tax=Microseira wollei TaxID=467598 RepID=A0AAV3X8V4_9CYAN|nr:CRISPR-associated endonuclease Cas2 [Microseira wollei]GET36794.1 transposase [Microseira wollei NIES-4236]
MQYSLFECEQKPTQYAKLKARLSKLIKPDEDSIHFYFICACCQGKVYTATFQHHPGYAFLFLCACCQGKVERIGGEQLLDTTVFFA